MTLKESAEMKHLGTLILCLTLSLGLLSCRATRQPAKKPASATSSSPASTPASGPKFKISQETTFILEPRTPDGYIDYVAAYNAECSRGVTLENNAAIPLIKALGPEAIRNKESRPRILKDLGLSDLPEKGEYFVPIDRFYDGSMFEDYPSYLDRKHALDEAFHRATTRPRYAETKVSEYLKAYEHALDLIVEASRKTRFYFPRYSASQPPTFYWDHVFGLHTDAFFALVVRANYRSHAGDFEGALDDVLALQRLAILFARTPCFENYYARFMGIQAVRAAVVVARSRELTLPQASRLLQALQAQEELPPLAPIRTDRYWALGRVQATSSVWLDVFWQPRPATQAATSQAATSQTAASQSATAEDPDDHLEPVALPPMDLDWDMYLKMMNAEFDRQCEIVCMKTHAQRWDAFERLESTGLLPEVRTVLEEEKNEEYFYLKNAHIKRLIELVGTSDKKKLTLAVYQLLNRGQEPAGDAFLVRDGVIMQWRIAQVIAALEFYRRLTGQYPESLDKLCPTFLKELPLDSFTGKPLHYQRRPKDYIIYSVGRNMRDDDGVYRSVCDGPDAPAKDDLGWDFSKDD